MLGLLRRPVRRRRCCDARRCRRSARCAQLQRYSRATSRRRRAARRRARVRHVSRSFHRVGNIAFEMKVKGHNVLHWPYASVEEFKAQAGLAGIPLLAPWANRLDEQAFYANGKRYAFDMALGQRARRAFRSTAFCRPRTSGRSSRRRPTRQSAWVTSRLEFFRQPAWMKQWPFAHTIEMTLPAAGRRARSARRRSRT